MFNSIVRVFPSSSSRTAFGVTLLVAVTSLSTVACGGAPDDSAERDQATSEAMTNPRARHKIHVTPDPLPQETPGNPKHQPEYDITEAEDTDPATPSHMHFDHLNVRPVPTTPPSVMSPSAD
jgi:hypothetical protein